MRLLPSATYRWQQGGVVADLSVALLANGTWSYGSQFAGYMAGDDTSTLTFYGYPLLVDARASGGTGLLVQPLKGFDPVAVHRCRNLNSTWNGDGTPPG